MVPIWHASIVIIGSFNPAIFHPEWFRTHDLLPRDEIDAATSRTASLPLFVSNQMTQVAFRSTRVNVTQETWEISTDRPDWGVDLAGLVISVFDILRETPVKLVGLNLIQHLPVEQPVSEVLESWAPLRTLGEAVGTSPISGARVRSTWEEFRVLVQMEASEVREKSLFLVQNYETSTQGTAGLVSVLSRWRDVMARATLVTAKLSKVRT